MPGRKSKIAGWILSVLLAAFLILGSASGKFTEFEGKDEMFDHLGYSSEVMVKIGVVEVIAALLFVIPRTGFLGAVLLTAYLGGATATHVRVGDPFLFPVIMGVVVWIAFGLRRPEVFSLAIGSPTSQPIATNEPT
ncbi:MAG: DoxX family protein [Planctomycetota bacterium]|nr:MAG: DoxX family protein [Planctomycetota bacterium]